MKCRTPIHPLPPHTLLLSSVPAVRGRSSQCSLEAAIDVTPSMFSLHTCKRGRGRGHTFPRGATPVFPLSPRYRTQPAAAGAPRPLAAAPRLHHRHTAAERHGGGGATAQVTRRRSPQQRQGRKTCLQLSKFDPCMHVCALTRQDYCLVHIAGSYEVSCTQALWEAGEAQ
jgi:hypothetical protein